MDGLRECHTEWSKSEKEFYVESLKNDTNELIYKTEKDSQT